MVETLDPHFSIHEDGSLRYDDRWCVLNDPGLRAHILRKAHKSSYSMLPDTDKVYQEPGKHFGGMV